MSNVGERMREAAEHNRHYETLRGLCLEGSNEIAALRDALTKIRDANSAAATSGYVDHDAVTALFTANGAATAALNR